MFKTKFGWQAECVRLQGEVETLRAKLRDSYAESERELAAERAARGFVRELRTRQIAPEEVKYHLGRLDDDDATYGAMMKVIQRQVEVETDVLLTPGRSNEERQYAAGRAAAVADVLFMLEGIRQEGRKLAAEAA